MKKLELIYRDVLTSFFSEKRTVFRQKDLALKFRCSVSTVSHALQAPRRSGAIRVSSRDFTLADAEKLLLYWATRRRLADETIFQTRAEGSAAQREGTMPAGVIFGAYSAYRSLYGGSPSDYDRVVVYAESAGPLRDRFPPRNGEPNLLVLKADPFLGSYGTVTPPAQIFVDLWNLPDWYAQDFRQALARTLLG